MSNHQSKLNLITEQIVRGNPNLIPDKYNAIFSLKTVTGVCFITKNSPHFISGKLSLRGRDNGSYPYRFKEMIAELFGECPSEEEEIEVCSGTVKGASNLITVDINPDKRADYTHDAQQLPQAWENRFIRWNCDPPYSEKAAERNVQFVRIALNFKIAHRRCESN